MLSAIAHGDGPPGGSIAEAAMAGFADLDEERGRLYAEALQRSARVAAADELLEG